MSEVKSYRDLLIWQRGIALSKDIYALTSDFPTQEQYGRSTASYINFLKISRGSLYELDTQLILSRELGLTKDEKLVSQLENEIAALGKMINALLIK